MYNRKEVAEKLGISLWTINKWYMWQSKLLKSSEITEPYLPEPIKAKNTSGNPNMWDEEMLERLRDFKNSIVHGRNGAYGKLSNPHFIKKADKKKEVENAIF